MAVSVLCLIQKLHEGYGEDQMAQQLLTELAIHPENNKGFSLKEGVIRHKEYGWAPIQLLREIF